MSSSKNDWIEQPFDEAVIINPKVTLEKGQQYPFVEMSILDSTSRIVQTSELREYKGGGSKFEDGDTLMARITPCLENGKISRYKSESSNLIIGFGSTEFIVIRGRDGVTDNDFVYYLTSWNEFRNYAIGQMNGSSGRQRVPTTSLSGFLVNLPPLPTQKKIASILSSLDDKIEINTRMNKVLEEIARALFHRWFVEFEFPDAEGRPYKSSGGKMIESEMGLVPEGWEVGTLGDIANITSGKRPLNKESEKTKDSKIPIIGASDVMGFTSEILYHEPILVTGRVGTHGIIQRSKKPCWPSDNTLVIVSKWYEFAFQNLLLINFKNMNRGSTQPLITQKDLKQIQIIFPSESVLNKFELMISRYFDIIDTNFDQNSALSGVRDVLLPKLMNGEIEL